MNPFETSQQRNDSPEQFPDQTLTGDFEVTTSSGSTYTVQNRQVNLKGVERTVISCEIQDGCLVINYLKPEMVTSDKIDKMVTGPLTSLKKQQS